MLMMLMRMGQDFLSDARVAAITTSLNDTFRAHQLSDVQVFFERPAQPLTATGFYCIPL